jgi:hypothetical protein
MRLQARTRPVFAISDGRSWRGQMSRPSRGFWTPLAAMCFRITTILHIVFLGLHVEEGRDGAASWLDPGQSGRPGMFTSMQRPDSAGEETLCFRSKLLCPFPASPSHQGSQTFTHQSSSVHLDCSTCQLELLKSPTQNATQRLSAHLLHGRRLVVAPHHVPHLLYQHLHRPPLLLGRLPELLLDHDGVRPR